MQNLATVHSRLHWSQSVLLSFKNGTACIHACCPNYKLGQVTEGNLSCIVRDELRQNLDSISWSPKFEGNETGAVNPALVYSGRFDQCSNEHDLPSLSNGDYR
jgi:hypothetical protein